MTAVNGEVRPGSPSAQGSPVVGGATRRAVERLGSILSIWAHPDDETYLAGGVMAAARHLGQRVVCATASAGEQGTADPGTWPPARLGRIRRWEASAALAVLGVEEHRFLRLPDGGLAEHDEVGARWVDHLLADVEPDTVLTFGADGVTFHPDHRAIHRWVTDAWHRRGRRARLLYATRTIDHLDRFDAIYRRLGVYMAPERPTGVAPDDLALHVQLDGVLLDQKVTALRAMATQTSDLVGAVGISAYLAMISEEGFVDATTAPLSPIPHERAGAHPRAPT